MSLRELATAGPVRLYPPGSRGLASTRPDAPAAILTNSAPSRRPSRLAMDWLLAPLLSTGVSLARPLRLFPRNAPTRSLFLEILIGLARVCPRPLSSARRLAASRRLRVLMLGSSERRRISRQTP